MILKLLFFTRFLAREKFDQLITSPTHIKGGKYRLYFVYTLVGKNLTFWSLQKKSANICDCIAY